MYYQMLHIVGRATNNPVLQDSKNGKKFCRVPVAVNQRKKRSEKEVEEVTYYYDILLFGKMAESAVKQVQTGDLVSSIGRPEFETYVSKKDKKVSKLKSTIHAEVWQVIK